MISLQQIAQPPKKYFRSKYPQLVSAKDTHKDPDLNCCDTHVAPALLAIAATMLIPYVYQTVYRLGQPR